MNTNYEYKKTYFEKKKSLGLCADCKNTPIEGQLCCETCAENHRIQVSVSRSRDFLKKRPSVPVRDIWQERCTGLLRYFIGLQKGSPFTTEDFIEWVEKTYPVSFPKPKTIDEYYSVIVNADRSCMIECVDGKWVGK